MRGDGRIFKHKESRFSYISYYHDKKEIRESTGPAILEAEAKKGRKLTDDEAMRVAVERLKKRIREVANEREAIRPFLGPAQERITVNQLLDDLVAQYELGGKKRIPREMGSGMRSNLKSVRDYFGEKRAATVTKRHVDEFITMLKSERKSNATVNRRTQLLSQAFKIAATADPPKALRPLVITKLDESDNVRKGKFTEQEAQLVFSSLPDYLVDVARFAYEVGSRRKELLNLRWSYVKGDAIEVPSEDTKTRKPRTIAVTVELKAILARRRAARVPGCDFIFHHDGHPIVDYRKSWHSACVVSGLGRFYCPKCRGEAGEYIFVLDATRKCPKCGEKPKRPKYIGRLFHDFRRSAAYELWKAGSTVEECMEVTGHRTEAMFKRYADLFSEEERRSIQRKAQKRRHEWRQAERERAAQAPDAPSVGECAAQERDSERVQ